MVTFVTLSVFEMPLSLAACRSGAAEGALGAVASIVIVRLVPLALWLPAASTA